MIAWAIRHLPTEWNEAGRLQGRRDISILPPSAAQQEKIDQLRLKLESMNFDAVLTSSLARTQQTADQLGFHYEVEPLLNELDFCAYEGKTKETLFADTEGKWITAPTQTVLADSILGLQSQVVQFSEKYSHLESVLLFTHGAWMRLAIALAENRPLDGMNSISIENLDLQSIEFPVQAASVADNSPSYDDDE